MILFLPGDNFRLPGVYQTGRRYAHRHTVKPNRMGGIMGIFWISIAGGFYFVPTLIAALRSHRWTAPIVVINLFAGWTVIGWVAALALAACPTPPKVTTLASSEWTPGWYPTVNGQTAYWDGTGWADPVLAN